MNKTLVLILGGGNGSRMKSKTPKILEEIASYTLIEYVLDICCRLYEEQNKRFEFRLIINSFIEKHPKYLAIYNKYKNKIPIDYKIQEEQLGTGHAVLTGLDKNYIEKKINNVLTIYADCPLISYETISNFIKIAQLNNDEKLNNCALFLSYIKDNPFGYGRIIMKENSPIKKSEYKNYTVKEIVAIIEENECTNEERKIQICNSGIFISEYNHLYQFTEDLTKKSKQKKEFYMTDFPEWLISKGKNVSCVICEKNMEEESININNCYDLSRAEDIIQKKLRKTFLDKGVKMIGADTIFFSYDTIVDSGVTIYPHVFISKGVKIDANTEIFSFSFLEDVSIGCRSKIGPFARIRGKTIIGEDVKIGNFTELKNSNLMNNVKAGHFSYIGDVDVKESANIGAGTVFCNFDGKNKHRSIVGKNAFIGSNSSIISPIMISDDSYVAAGSVITENIPENNLGIARSKQVNIPKKKI